MRSVRDTARMQRDRSGFDSLSRTEIAAHVEEHFVGFDVVVHPWNFHCLRMIIEHPRRECADDVAADFESLMDRRRLMHGAGDRLEILGVKSERIDEPIPTDDVEGVMGM